ncbi:hypothetical protein Syun_004835 [Stephania yunnanensis]|uniref:TSL-kinase interacting protein 1 n=1 Tax=Stephania yunnanensis TaxID=152371 RepID=A0AAP0L3S9_9MAGN
MKTARVQAAVTGDTSARGKKIVGVGGGRGKASTKKIGKHQFKSKGQSDGNASDKVGKTLLSPMGQTFIEQLSTEGACLAPKEELKQTLQRKQKIKVQFFPIDAVTRRGLEKDGYNPHLELILSDRKKIASVLTHLQSKWGGSSMAVGKLVLFPYNINLENLGRGMKWTLEDSVTCASDVYAAVGRPPIFRLRYGWFGDLEFKTSDKSLTFSCVGNFSKHKNLEENLDANFEVNDGKMQPCKPRNQDGRPILNSQETKSLNGPQGTTRMGDSLTLSSSLWTDSLTNLSIGGLLSEASMNALADSSNPMPTGNKSSFQQIPFSSDSFDAAIAAHIYSRQDFQQPAQTSNRSFFDAEETCNEFPFQKFAFSRKDVSSSSKTSLSASSQDANDQAGVSKDHSLHDKKVDTSPFTKETDALSCFGMPANWPDSLGPFDLGLSSFRQLISGDGINSMDAFQNCLRFCKDGKVAP